MLRVFIFTLSCLASVAITTLYAEEYDRIDGLSGFVDLRTGHSDRARSWLEAGAGKSRYGGSGRHPRSYADLAQISLLWQPQINDHIDTHLQINLDSDTRFSDPGGRADWIEGFVTLTWADFSDKWTSKIRGGLFFPNVSLEHIGPAWSTVKTITPSAINSWIGEEIKALGLEHISIFHATNSIAIKLSTAVFGHNDPAGSLLSYRGWALHDRQSGWGDKLKIPKRPAFNVGMLFADQALYVMPNEELDDRLGYWAGLEAVNDKNWLLSYLYYDNQANPTAFDGQQYAWKTTFHHLAARYTFHPQWEIASQWMRGNTKMGFDPSLSFLVNNNFQSHYFMLSYEHERWLHSIRYEEFNVDDRDRLQHKDDNREKGQAWTLATRWLYQDNIQFLVEYLRVTSRRPERVYLNQDKSLNEDHVNVSWRMSF